jgi:hypothetical protein
MKSLCILIGIIFLTVDCADQKFEFTFETFIAWVLLLSFAASSWFEMGCNEPESIDSKTLNK